MTESTPDSTHPAEPTADPTTIVGLIFRVLNRPSRTLCLLAILAVLLAGIAELMHAPPIAQLPVGVWGAAIGGASLLPIAVRQITRRWFPNGRASGIDYMASEPNRRPEGLADFQEPTPPATSGLHGSPPIGSR